MIRRVELQDAKAIAAIYNEYVIHSVVTFDIEPVREEDMRGRIAGISAHYPYFVCESDGKSCGGIAMLIPGNSVWPTDIRWRQLFTFFPIVWGKGMGTQLMMRLIEECRREGYHALIACLTEPNEDSTSLHTKLGFQKVSHFKEVGLKFGRWLDVSDYELIL